MHRLGGGEVTTHTHVSGEMVKPSMYNCLTLIRRGGGGGGAEGDGVDQYGAKSPVSKPGGRRGEDVDSSRLLFGCRFVSHTRSRPDFVH